MTGRSVRRRRAAAVLTGVALALGMLTGQPSGRGEAAAAPETSAEAGVAAGGGPAGARAGKRPNVVLIVTDDMTSSDLRSMRRTRALLGRRGVTFPQMVSPHPLCCPARAAILTGQYAQNNHVKTNQGRYAFDSLATRRTLPVWLQRAGYRTAFTGKYLNGFGSKGRSQPGWTWFDPSLRGQYAYDDYRMWRNGSPRRYVGLNNVDYINNTTLQLIRRWAPGPKPFFIWASHVAPHGRADPATGRIRATALPPKRYRKKFRHATPPSLKDPAFNESIRDKNGWLNRRHSKKIPPSYVKRVWRTRVQSLQAVDQGVARIVRQLRDVGELDNTLIVFTSDNGFLLGEHRLLTKNLPYRQSLGVPLLMRGPGIPRGVRRNQFATTIDLAPTIADVARARPNVTVDGRSLMPAIRRDAPLRSTVLIQAGPQEKSDRRYGWWWRGVTTGRYTYAYFLKERFAELYDHRYDPGETTNLADHPYYRRTVEELHRRTVALGTCRGPTSCSRSFGTVPGPLLPPTGLGAAGR